MDEMGKQAYAGLARRRASGWDRGGRSWLRAGQQGKALCDKRIGEDLGGLRENTSERNRPVCVGLPGWKGAICGKS